ncbi:MAG: radical SAM protein [Syntrophobacteraceae bacterium]
MKTTPIPPVRYLVLWLTTGCNLRCAYCYRGDPPSRSMSREVARASLSLAASSGFPFHVQMAGGEPTLEPKLIEAVGRTVREASWPATMAVQTNGTLIDKHLIDICLRYSISLGISLDGPPDAQERIRGRAGATFRALELLSEAEVPVRITTVLSALNIMDLWRLILSLAPYVNVRGVAIDPVVLKGKASDQDIMIPSKKDLSTGVADMLAMLREVNRLRSSPIRWRELDSVINALGGDGKRKNYCHACAGESLAVHPDGTVYPCGQTIGDPAMEAGSVDHVDWERLRGIFRETGPSGECPECSLRNRCPGDCPSRMHYNENYTSNQTMCLIYRTILECLERRGRP